MKNVNPEDDARPAWNRGWAITDDEREAFRQMSKRSSRAKARAMNGDGPDPIHEINVPRFDPDALLPQQAPNDLSSLSLFSGCGGLDLGFDRAGFTHVASFDHYAPAAESLLASRPKWSVCGGAEGDVVGADWRKYRGKVDVVHGGPPCQPFSASGRQLGSADARDMFPQFVRAVLEIKPRAFVAENVPALAQAKFATYVSKSIVGPLSKSYTVRCFRMSAADFGVPQTRTRLIFVGFRNKRDAARFEQPVPTHRVTFASAKRADEGAFVSSLIPLAKEELPACMGARFALGLPDFGYDALAPTLRSSLTGPRHTTSILSSVSALRLWDALRIWPNGVARTREEARKFVASNGHFRLSVADCALLQGFPSSWTIVGSTYSALGQIGNAVAPPVAFALARAIAAAL